MEMRRVMNKSKAITIGNGRSAYGNSPGMSLLMGDDARRNGSDSGEEHRRGRRRQRTMTIGSSESSSSSSSDNEQHGTPFDSNIKFS